MNNIHKRYENGVRTNDALTCPQCGAPIDNEKCSYCGVVFYDFACVDANKPFFLKIKLDDQIHVYKVKMDNCEVKMSNNDIKFYADTEIFSVISRQDVDIDMHFHMVE